MVVTVWTGHETKLLRRALRMTIAEFAEHLGVSSRGVDKWEARGAAIEPTPELQRALDTALARADTLANARFRAALAGEADERDQSSAHGADVSPRESAADGALNELEKARRLLDAVCAPVADRDDLALGDWEVVASKRARATRYQAAGLLLTELTADCAGLGRRFGAGRSVSARRRLTRVTAQIAGLTSLTLIKLNRVAESHRWATTARVAAEDAGDPAMQSWVVAQGAYTAFYASDLRRAVDVARHSQALAGAACVGLVLAAALQARAHALMGQKGETYAALAVAEATLSRLDGDSVSESAFGYSEAQYRFHEGNALTHLGDTAAAQISIERALEIYPQGSYSAGVSAGGSQGPVVKRVVRASRWSFFHLVAVDR